MSRMKLDHDVMNVYLPLKWVGDGRKRGVTINTPSLLRSQEIVRLRFPNAWRLGCSLKILPVSYPLADRPADDDYKHESLVRSDT